MYIIVLIFGNMCCSKVLQLLCLLEVHSKCILYSRSLRFCFFIYRNLSCWFKRWCVAAFIVLHGSKDLKPPDNVYRNSRNATP